MTTLQGRQVGEPEPQIGPLGPAQIIHGPCEQKNQARLNGFCRDIPDAGLTKCGVVDLQYNDYMIYEEKDSPDSQSADPENINQRRRRRSIRRGPSLTRIIGGQDSQGQRWPWQISITKNMGKIPDPMTITGSNGCVIFF